MACVSVYDTRNPCKKSEKKLMTWFYESCLYHILWYFGQAPSLKKWPEAHLIVSGALDSCKKSEKTNNSISRKTQITPFLAHLLSKLVQKSSTKKILKNGPYHLIVCGALDSYEKSEETNHSISRELKKTPFLGHLEPKSPPKNWF